MRPGTDAGARRRALAPHPQAVPPEELLPILTGFPLVNSLTCVALLPAESGLSAAKLPGLALSVTEAVTWLVDLGAAFETRALQPGHSLRSWSAAAKLLLELMARGRFVPVLRAEAGVLTSDWRLGTAERADAERLSLLEAALPDVCRAVVPPDRSHKSYRPPSGSALLGAFLRTATQALAQRFLADAPVPEAPVGPAPAAVHWVRALAGAAGADLPPGVPDANALYQAVADWTSAIAGGGEAGALRTGIRLLPPEETDDGEWALELVIQTPTDPPVTVPAADLFARPGDELTLGNERYLHPEQRLFLDLPVMSRLFPPLGPLAVTPAMGRTPLGEEAVIALLQDGARLLTEAGFAVLLPAGLVRAANLRGKMRLKPGGAGESHFGLSQIVQVDWELALGGAQVSYADLQHLARQKRPLVQHQGKWVLVDQASLNAALKNLAPVREEIALGEALRLAARGAGGLEVEAAEAEGWVSSLLDRLREPARIEPVAVPASFRGELRPYQQRGLDWLAFLTRFSMGACLADDMGLGKTVQVISLLCYEREQRQVDRPTLLVCPVSVVGNWKRELQRFAPHLRVLVHHGSGRASEEAFQAEASAHDVVLTTYSLLGRDQEALAAVDWAGIVADEAQNIKNPSTRHAQAIRSLRGGYRIALTGTPVENHLGDLWSIFAFLNPGLLGGAEEFRKSFALPIERYQDEEAAARLRRLVQPFLLRRLKSDPSIIADLPEKLENVVHVNLTVEQASLYEAVVQETLERANDAVGIQRHGAVLAGLTRLKQLCNHPANLLGGSGALGGRSGKLDRLVEMLQEVIAEGDRALIFTQFAQFGERLKEYLARTLGCAALFLDGSTPQAARERLIDRFQSGEAPLFVLSLKAGGVGLNLTAANHVFHVDRWWNPAVEDQATDRAYRIGQTRRVLVHKLVTAGTLEERIDRLLTEKRALSGQVVGAGESWLGDLSTDELRELITLEKE